MTRKYGRLPAYDPAVRPRLLLGPALRLNQIVIPPTIDELSEVTDWPMYLNDQIGDCTFAAAGHMIEATTQYGQGATVKVTDRDVLTGYSAVSGYNSATGANDDGCVMQDVLDYWRKTGIGGHRILAFAEIDVHNPDEIAAALYLFGHVYVGLNVPASAETQFDNGQPWDVVTRDGGILGGHAINVGARPLEGVTWGRRQKITTAFWAKYVEEAWVVADQSWISKTGGSPPGLDPAALNAQFTAMTHQPGPFPSQPAPTPVPPTPTPVPGDPDAALAAVAHHWVTEHHIGDNHKMQVALKAWLAAKGL